MSTTSSPVPFESLTALSRAVDQHLAERSMRTVSAVFNLCVEAVAFGREADQPMVGTRAGSAAYLLLELALPDLDPTVLEQLAAACARAATGRH
jgi:hypothetical protein